MEVRLSRVEALSDGDIMPGSHFMIFEFNPHDASLTRVGDIYSDSPFNRREAYEDARALAEQSARRNANLQYVVSRVTPQGGFKAVGN